MKTEKNISKFVIGCFAVLFAVGCQPARRAVTPEEPKKQEKTQDSAEQTSLLDLQKDFKIIPLENPKQGAISGSELLVAVESVQTDSIYEVIEDIPDEFDSLNSQAYRVQIFSSKTYGDTRHAKTVAEEIFDRPVFLDYEVPYYKIRVGNFSDRDKAEEYQQRVKSSGYKNAWVVVVILNIRETSPLYDEILTPEEIDSLYNDQPENEPEGSE